METSEKIFYVVKAIKEAYEITPNGEATLVDPQSPFMRKVSELNRNQIITKLEKDERLLEIGGFPEGYADDCYVLYIKPAFLAYAEKIISSYEVKSAEKELISSKTSANAGSGSFIFQIVYSDRNREITLNDYFLLSKPDFGSENDLVFCYLFKNPNRKVTIKEIEEAENIKIKKTPHAIIRDLGFTHDLGKIFFSVSADTFIFYNPVTPKHLEELGISKIKISAKPPPKLSEKP